MLYNKLLKNNCNDAVLIGATFSTHCREWYHYFLTETLTSCRIVATWTEQRIATCWDSQVCLASSKVYTALCIVGSTTNGELTRAISGEDVCDVWTCMVLLPRLYGSDKDTKKSTALMITVQASVTSMDRSVTYTFGTYCHKTQDVTDLLWESNESQPLIASFLTWDYFCRTLTPS